MYKSIIFMTVLFHLSYSLTTINYESEKVNATNDGKVDDSLKVVMPTTATEKQVIYDYLNENVTIFDGRQHLIFEHADDSVIEKFVDSYKFDMLTSLALPSSKLTDNGALKLAQSNQFADLKKLSLEDSDEITEIGQLALIKQFKKLEDFGTSVTFGDNIMQKVVIKVDDFVRHGAEKLNVVLVPEPFARDSDNSSKIQYNTAKFRFKLNRNHYDNRDVQPIDTLVMHYTVSNFDSTMNTFTEDKDDGRVSAHWVITQSEENNSILKGGIPVSVVPENKRAWHAGIGVWQNISSLNKISIGIESVNKGWESEGLGIKWFPFDKAQIETLSKLSQDLIKKNAINPTRIIAHADLAFNRKQDPGILFPWRELYLNYGIGAFLTSDELKEEYIRKHYKPEEELPKEPNVSFFLKQLKKYGYDIKDYNADIKSTLQDSSYRKGLIYIAFMAF